jgi:hypothetical protein
MLSAYVARTHSPKPGAARDALRFADQAAHAARHETMRRLCALIALRRADAISLLGDRAGFQAAITDARRELDRGVDDDPEWIKFVDESEILTHEARGLESLGDPATACELHRQSLEMAGLSPRNRACGQAQLAAALAIEGDTASAVDEGNTALSAFQSGVTSVRVLNELRPVRQAAEQINAEEFCERFDIALQALTT